MRTLRHSWLELLIIGTGVLLFTGCATPTHRFSHNGATQASTLKRIVVLPIDVEVSELSAGGLSQKREDWSTAAANNLSTAIAARTSCKFVTPADAKSKIPAGELLEVQALFRTILINQALHTFYGPPLLASTSGPLTYKVGSIDKIADAVDADAVVLIFMRSDYATAGRKTVAALGVLAGIPVQGDLVVTGAALVSRDGTLLWMNQLGTNSKDVREGDEAEDVIQALLSGFPAAPAS